MWGDILSTAGDVQYRGNIMSSVGAYFEDGGGYSVSWEDIMMHVGRYHEHRGEIPSFVI